MSAAKRQGGSERVRAETAAKKHRGHPGALALLLLALVLCAGAGTWLFRLYAFGSPGFPGQPKIAFKSADGVYTINPDGTDLTRVCGKEYVPFGWSTDHASVYLEGRFIGPDKPGVAPLQYETAAVDADGGNLRELKRDEIVPNWTVPTYWDRHRETGWPVPSPDGRFRVFREGMGTARPRRLYVQRFDGTGTRLLTPTTPEYGPGRWRGDPIYWALDGSKIFYGAGEGIYTVRPDGSSPEVFLAETPCRGWPNADQTTRFCASEHAGNSDIYSMDMDGSNAVNLTNHPARESVFDLSPDETQIAFLSDRDGDQELFVMGADGTGVRQLTFNDEHEYWPTWHTTRWPSDAPVTSGGTDSLAGKPVDLAREARETILDAEGLVRNWEPAQGDPLAAHILRMVETDDQLRTGNAEERELHTQAVEQLIFLYVALGQFQDARNLSSEHQSTERAPQLEEIDRIERTADPDERRHYVQVLRSAVLGDGVELRKRATGFMETYPHSTLRDSAAARRDGHL